MSNKPSQDPKDFWHRRASRIDEIMESWRTAASFAEMALKSAMLLNGAAAVAMLAFIANQSGDPTPTQSGDTTTVKNLARLVPVLHHFLWGTFSAVLATAAAYFSAYVENRGLWRWVENKKYGRLFDWGELIFMVSAIILVGYSYLEFWLGMEAGTNALLE